MKPYDETVQLDSVLPFRNHVVISGRRGGSEKIWVAANRNLAEWREIGVPEEVYSIWCGDNYEYDSDTFRYVYSSFITPKTWIDYNLNDHTSKTLKVQEVPGYDITKYVTRRLFAPARDGTSIPLSIVHLASISLPDGGSTSSQPLPCILYGYGSYGHCVDPVFDYKRTALLDRGVVYVVAHVRGGGEMGKHWYEDQGKYLTKMNTFNDFGDCAQHLISTGITSSQKLCGIGRSAGGLLMGAVANMFPHLFKVLVADVPFVDAVNTMSDPTIPLTGKILKPFFVIFYICDF